MGNGWQTADQVTPRRSSAQGHCAIPWPLVSRPSRFPVTLRRSRHRHRMRLLAVLLVALLVALLAPCARTAGAQAADTARRTLGTTVSGVAHDSVARRPLTGAMVQLVSADGLGRFSRSASTDSLGRFALGNVPPGRYTLGFFHAMLDSLGLEPPVREVVVDEHRALRADLAIPSPARLRTAICGSGAKAGANADSGAIVIGIVRDARDRAPVAGATVTTEWLEISFTRNGIVRRVPRLVATTGAGGWFALCDVPSAGIVALAASRGADSTDLLEMQVPSERFLRRDLYLGPARSTEERLSGMVVTVGGNPVGGAEVRMGDGPRLRANERGEWTLPSAAMGTRMLEVRALGYYPMRLPVDVVPGSAPVRVALSTLKAVLDTVRVTASRILDRQLSNFEDRRRMSGTGRYLTPLDISRRNPLFVSQLFRSVPGMRVERGEEGTAFLQVRDAAGDWCAPTVYLNGMHLGELTADEIDDWVQPHNIAGIEIYSTGNVPLEFSRGMAGTLCGAVVIWTK